MMDGRFMFHRPLLVRPAMSFARGSEHGEKALADRMPDRADKAAGRRFRHRSVVLLKKAGAKNAEITAAFGYTPQHIRRILKAAAGGRPDA